ncbi:MAG: hypothetical protein QM736_05495 [Vicinamibacterales bacterium]
MTEPFDEQLRRAFDSLAERMRSTVADHVAGSFDELRTSLAAERATAIDTATREASTATEQAVIARLEAEYAAREAALKESVRAEAFDAGLAQARADALAEQQTRDAQAEAAAQAEAEAASRRLAAHQEELAAIRAEATAQLDAALTAARVDAAAVAAQHEQAVAALHAEVEQARAAAVEAAAQHADAVNRLRDEAERAADTHRGALDAANNAAAQAAIAAEAAQVELAAARARIDRESVERLLAAVRALDASTSLSQTLDALAAAASAEAGRTAVFLVRGDVLRVWNQHGFDALPQGGTVDVPLAEAGIVADAVRGHAAHRIAANGDGRPAFAGSGVDGALVAVPLTMNGQVIAVLCGEQHDSTDAGAWLATHYEVLARHAARVLESLTALRLAQLGAHPAQAGHASPPQ